MTSNNPIALFTAHRRRQIYFIMTPSLWQALRKKECEIWQA
nr:MAG TPA: hypothetical protein [Bacteriophage sp.]